MKINKITGVIKATNGDVASAIAYDDMLGEVRSSITGEIGILDADSHSQMIQLGSVNPSSDE